jgi:SHS2 domain-containing protein
MGSESVPRGISFLDHTADVGVEVHASSLPDLFILAALGMTGLVYGADLGAEADTAMARPTPPTARAPLAAGESASAGAPVRRVLSLSAEDAPTLLRAWLRSLLGWLETEGLSLRAARFDALTETRLGAVVDLAPDTREPIREIKGVTLHGLVAERRGTEWTGRVIFDV